MVIWRLLGLHVHSLNYHRKFFFIYFDNERLNNIRLNMSQFCRVHPKLIPYITALASHEFGLQGIRAEIKNVESGSIISKTNKLWGDRFLVRILYCTKKLNWQVLMCPDNLMEPPDFIMEDDFLAEADIDLIQSQVPSLANWQPSDPKCLLYVILELLELYKSFQANLVSRESRLGLEYKGLLRYTEATGTDFEFNIYNSSRASFLAHMKIDYSKLPIPIPKRKYLTLLLVELADNTKNVTSLLKHGDLDEVYGNVDLPELGSGTLLMHYIPFIRDYLQSKVDELVWRLKQRKIFYSFLLQVFEPAILNGDYVTYRSLTVLLENNGTFYVLNIQIPLNFPESAPEINIASMRKPRSGVPIFIPLDKFRYDSDWDMEKIFKNLYEFIIKLAIPLYQKQISVNETKSRK